MTDTTVVSVPGDQITVVSVPSVTTVSAGTPGLQGPAGETGSDLLTREASGSIGGHRVVVSNGDGTVSYASAATAAHLGRVIGITLTAAGDGDLLNIKRMGAVDFNGWDWTPADPIFLSTDGLLTQTPPVSGFMQIVGFAESPTRLFVDLREPLKLS